MVIPQPVLKDRILLSSVIGSVAERLYGTISAPGVDGGKVLRPMPESPRNLPQIRPKFAPCRQT
jgi:hypothetical protein